MGDAVVVVACVIHTATPPGAHNRLLIGAWQLVRRRQLQRTLQQRRRLRTWRQEGCWTSLLASLCRRHHQLHVSTVCVSWWWCCRSSKCSRVVVCGSTAAVEAFFRVLDCKVVPWTDVFERTHDKNFLPHLREFTRTLRPGTYVVSWLCYSAVPPV